MMMCNTQTYAVRYMHNTTKCCDLSGWEVYNINNNEGHSWYRTNEQAERVANSFNNAIEHFYSK